MQPGGLAWFQPFHGKGMAIIILLVLINIVNFIDRQLPFILMNSIKIDLGLTDTQIGLMAGLTFAIVYSVMGLPLAWLADRWSPRKVLVIALSFWSVMTALGGLATSFLHLAAARVGVAGAEAASTPTSHAFISRSFAPSRRALTLALFSLGVPIGSTLGLVLGGWINDLANWRVAFFIVGLPGLALAVIAWFVLPELGKTKGEPKLAMPYWGDVAYLFRLRSFRNMALASSLYAIGSYAMNVFASSFFIRVHGLTTAQAGMAFGLAFGLGGGLGTFAGGYFGDKIGLKDPRWRQWIPAIGQLLSAPTAAVTWLCGETWLSIVALILTYFFGLLYFAPSFATAQMLAPDRMRATSSAVLLFCLTLVGSSVGPIVVGKVSDMLVPTYGATSLRYAMALMVVTMLWSAWHYHLAARALPGDLARPAVA